MYFVALEMVEIGKISIEYLVEIGYTIEKNWWKSAKALYSRYIPTTMEKNTILFKRKMYDRLLKWKKERNGESAILIQGARWKRRVSLTPSGTRDLTPRA